MEIFLDQVFFFAALVYSIICIFNKKTYIGNYYFKDQPAVIIGSLMTLSVLFIIVKFFSTSLSLISIIVAIPIGIMGYHLLKMLWFDMLKVEPISSMSSWHSKFVTVILAGLAVVSLGLLF